MTESELLESALASPTSRALRPQYNEQLRGVSENGSTLTVVFVARDGNRLERFRREAREDRPMWLEGKRFWKVAGETLTPTPEALTSRKGMISDNFDRKA